MKTSTILTGIIAVCIIIGVIFWIKSCNEEQKQIKEISELNQIGVSQKVNDSLKTYIAKVYQGFIDSLINVNSDLKAELKTAKEKPEIVTVYKTNTVYKDVLIPTMWADSGTRTAKYNTEWLNFEANYQLVEPFRFNIKNISIPDSYEIVQTTTTEGRKKIYVKNHNPYIKVEELISVVEPEYLLKEIPVEKNYWEWMGAYTYSPGNKTTNAYMGAFTPFGLGVVVGLNNIPQNVNKNYNVGLGFLKKF